MINLGRDRRICRFGLRQGRGMMINLGRYLRFISLEWIPFLHALYDSRAVDIIFLNFCVDSHAGFELCSGLLLL